MSTETLERPSTTVEVVTVRHVEITEEHVENIVSTAGYGIAYWAKSLPSERWHPGDALAFIEVGDGDEDVEHHLDADAIRQTWAEIAAGDHDDKMAAYIRGYFRTALETNEPDDLDSEAVDVLVQIAALGKVVYG
ncbi:hypothetical protein [Cellulosimicrobium sp. TH-20]|uniref:hypothetical protein n=1 Tax=Cellulosimicrobium sp. TH-20 TaxID=1980001 RepID=UPI0011A26C1E|nr:hypothetical protein [Cellulosimicrobium sp. TH-20]